MTPLSHPPPKEHGQFDKYGVFQSVIFYLEFAFDKWNNVLFMTPV